MSELFGSDAFAPQEVAQRLESLVVTKDPLTTVPLQLSGHTRKESDAVAEQVVRLALTRQALP